MFSYLNCKLLNIKKTFSVNNFEIVMRCNFGIMLRISVWISDKMFSLWYCVVFFLLVSHICVFSVNLQQFWPAVNQNSQPPNSLRNLSLSNQRSLRLYHHSPAVLAPYTLTCGPPPFPESAVQRKAPVGPWLICRPWIMDDGNQAPSWPTICSTEGCWPCTLAGPEHFAQRQHMLMVAY